MLSLLTAPYWVWHKKWAPKLEPEDSYSRFSYADANCVILLSLLDFMSLRYLISNVTI